MELRSYLSSDSNRTSFATYPIDVQRHILTQIRTCAHMRSLWRNFVANHRPDDPQNYPRPRIVMNMWHLQQCFAGWKLGVASGTCRKFRCPGDDYGNLAPDRAPDAQELYLLTRRDGIQHRRTLSAAVNSRRRDLAPRTRVQKRKARELAAAARVSAAKEKRARVLETRAGNAARKAAANFDARNARRTQRPQRRLYKKRQLFPAYAGSTPRSDRAVRARAAAMLMDRLAIESQVWLRNIDTQAPLWFRPSWSDTPLLHMEARAAPTTFIPLPMPSPAPISLPIGIVHNYTPRSMRPPPTDGLSHAQSVELARVMRANARSTARSSGVRAPASDVGFVPRRLFPYFRRSS